MNPFFFTQRLHGRFSPWRYAILVFIILHAAIAGLAQGVISGKITEQDGSPLSFANVLLLNVQDSSMVKGEVANAEGQYHLKNVARGDYRIMASMVGYKKYYSSVFSYTGTDLVFEVIKVEEEGEVLNEVVVTVKKPLFEQQMDKLVVNIENSITAAGGTALEVLERSPGVIVNRQSNTLSLSGKQGVLVMMNGKVQRLPMQTVVQMLSGMNANTIEKIEIITNPSSKYDAQGDGGIINIIFKQNPDLGTNGSYSLSAGYGWREKYGASFNINHRTKKINIYADYSANVNRTKQYFDFTRNVDGEYTATNSLRFANDDVHRASVGGDIFLSEKTTIGMMVSGFDNYWSMDATNDSHSSVQGEPTRNILLKNREINHWKNLIGNANIRHTFASGSLLTFDADFLYYNDNNPHRYNNAYQYPQDEPSDSTQQIRISKKTPIHMMVLKGDYEFKIKKVKVETGLKSSFSRLSNRVLVESKEDDDTWKEDATFSQDYKLKDDVLAAYVTLSGDINPKTKIMAGLRTESTNMNITNAQQEKIFDLDFWSLFPTLFLSRKLNENHTMQFSYGRRITRPSYEDIAPFVVFIDPYSYFSGNPKLKPTLTNNLQLNYLYKDFLLSVKYSLDKNYIANFQTRVDPVTKKTFLYSENMNQVGTYNLNLSIPFDVTKWWKVNSNVNANYQIIKTVYVEEKVSLSQFAVNFNASNSFTIGNGFSAELSGYYSTPSLFGITRLKDFGSINAGLQKTFKNNKGTLRLNASDIFWMNIWRFETQNKALNIDQTGVIKFESRVVRLSYTRNFGRNSVKSGRGRSTASEAERGRVKN
jgi:hypothetical protein